LQLFDASDFKISAPQCPTHYSPVGNGDVLDIVVHKDIRLSNVVSDILNSDHLPIILKTSWITLDLKMSRHHLRKLQRLTSNLISPRIEINSGVEADKAVYSLYCFGI
jgi:hypothetical protein